MPDVLVVGGGPAGLSAALAAHDAGADVLVIERGDRPGGVLNQCIHDGFGVIEYGERLTGPEYSHRQVAALREAGDCGANGRTDPGTSRAGPIRLMTGAYLHTMRREGSHWRLDVITANGVHSIDTASLVMATGCRERTDRQIYLHGDRPAGIFTAGQAQRLINIDGAMPGREIVILGSGDIGLIMARRLTLEGAHVRGVYEIQSAASGLARNVAQCLQDWNIPLHLHRTVTEVHGCDRVNAVTVCSVDDAGIPDRDSAVRIPCDTLLLSVGLIPENDVIADLGIRLEPATGGPAVTQARETEFAGIYVCGNALQVYDLVDYVSECGRASGLAAAAHARDSSEHAESPLTGGRSSARYARSARLQTAGIVGHVCPQLLDPTAQEPPVLFLRVTEAADAAVLTVSHAGRVLQSRRLSYLRPPQMVRYPMDAGAWAAVRENPSVTVVEVSRAG